MPDAYVLSGTLISDGHTFADSVVAVAGGRIAYAGPRSGFSAAGFRGARELRLPPGGSILPGLVDLHCHGAAGGGFPTGDSRACRAAVGFLHRSGTTTLLASLVSAPAEELVRGIGVLRPLADEGLIAGIHAEGPFLSRARCGAQNPEWLRNPDPALLRRLLDAAGGTLKTMTYAPELPGAAELVSMLTGNGVTPSLGHTDAGDRTTADSLTGAAQSLRAGGAARASGAAGAGTGPRPTVTHLFNGMPPLHHRSPGPVAACLRLAAAGTVAVELIGDGVHLDPGTVRMVFGLVGADNIALVTDSMAATGLPDGDYELGPSAVVVRDGVASLKSNGALAGGTATLLEVVRRTIEAGVAPADAVKAATLVPARILGLETEIGSLRAGMRADIVAVDRDFGLVEVLRGGQPLVRPAARIRA
ncbi:N-acetylglucosamine-6-phosphate deacetylase [Arthrobacter sp. U41]|uniref:N-acetylglucosamine-6-phosphate deacetylase n=1 Tax=Arthrobacter sp. U41 TaxID=1849032 RepID=UPI0008596927|nr:N-acetylglucosamine-6-phosphate deacetylase [Arthrobacter sp. U41]AOT02656.1 N-acetylglucosamine-6-phosphate deacetylase [Arthrobacter sp. U41]